MSWGLYSSEYEEWPSGIWHHVLQYVKVQLPLSMPYRHMGDSSDRAALIIGHGTRRTRVVSFML